MITTRNIPGSLRLLGKAGLLTLLLALGLAPSALAQYHEDNKYGYKIGIPRDWQEIPLKVDESWIIAKYLGDRGFTHRDPKDFPEHKPDMQVIAFVERVTDGGPEVEAEKKSDDEIVIKLTNPYKDYPDYLRRTFTEGGWYEHGREEREVNGVSVTCLDIKVEKLTTYGPMRLITWIYHLEGVDLAVQFQCIEQAYPKLGGAILGSLKSFREIERTQGPIGPGEVTGSTIRFSNVKMDKMTPDQRRIQRIDAEKALHEKMKERLPSDWQAIEVGNFLLLDHAGDRFSFAKKILTQAQAVMGWLEKTFPEVGEGEYVRSPIIRVCKDIDEERAFRKGSDGWGGMSTEIVTHKDTGFGGDYEMRWVNMRIMEIWFQDRDRELYWALPPWLGSGLTQLIYGAKARGRGIQFPPDAYDRVELKVAAQKRELTSPLELMKMDSSAFNDSGSINSAMAAELVRFLVAGPGAKNRQTKDIISNYMANLKAVITEYEEKDESKDDSSDPMTEEEEEEHFRKQREKWQKRRQEVLDAVFEKTFADWSEQDWKRFEQAYFKSVL
ncbi:MAG: hypothetical protein RL885_17535 [Planctomycetota bacterium]